MPKVADLRPPTPVSWISIILTFKLLSSAYLEYILIKSEANKPASSPPVPALISIIAFLLSFGSSDINIFLSFASTAAICLFIVTDSSLASSSYSLSSFISSTSDNCLFKSINFLQSWYDSSSALFSLDSEVIFSWFSIISLSIICCMILS